MGEASSGEVLGDDQDFNVEHVQFEILVQYSGGNVE